MRIDYDFIITKAKTTVVLYRDLIKNTKKHD